jgi:hypothetical protein
LVVCSQVRSVRAEGAWLQFAVHTNRDGLTWRNTAHGAAARTRVAAEAVGAGPPADAAAKAASVVPEEVRAVRVDRPVASAGLLVDPEVPRAVLRAHPAVPAGLQVVPVAPRDALKTDPVVPQVAPEAPPVELAAVGVRSARPGAAPRQVGPTASPQVVRDRLLAAVVPGSVDRTHLVPVAVRPRVGSRAAMQLTPAGPHRPIAGLSTRPSDPIGAVPVARARAQALSVSSRRPLCGTLPAAVPGQVRLPAVSLAVRSVPVARQRRTGGSKAVRRADAPHAVPTWAGVQSPGDAPAKHHGGARTIRRRAEPIVRIVRRGRPDAAASSAPMTVAG